SWNGTTYILGAPNASNSVDAAGQTIALAGGFDSAITFLAAGVNGDQLNQTFTVTYTDNSTQTFTQSLNDWSNVSSYSGQTVVASTSYRDHFNGTTQSGGPFKVFGYSFLLNSAK